MLPLHYLADKINGQRSADAERLRRGRLLRTQRRAAARAVRTPGQAFRLARRAIQIRP